MNTYNEKEESEPEEMQQITLLNRVLPDENDNHGIKLKSTAISKFHHRYRFSGHNNDKQPRTLRPKRYQIVEKKISRREQKRN